MTDVYEIDEAPVNFLRKIGEVFAEFGGQTQDSGNLSYGVRLNDERFFVKTAGPPDLRTPFMSHPDRVELLRNAARVADDCTPGAVPRLRRVIESPDGPMLVYDWAEGDLLGVSSAVRNDPDSSFQRFRSLPARKVAASLDVIYRLHRDLAGAGWIAVDFYDGCLIYDFSSERLAVVDLDMYLHHPFVNHMGRMFGSTRFMAPEEFEAGAMIDERTNVYVMGRTASVLLGDGTLDAGPFRGSTGMHAVMVRACAIDRSERFESLEEFYDAWHRSRA